MGKCWHKCTDIKPDAVCKRTVLYDGKDEMWFTSDKLLAMLPGGETVLAFYEYSNYGSGWYEYTDQYKINPIAWMEIPKLEGNE